MGNPYFYLYIGSLSFSGFWTGLLKPFGRWGSAAGFLFSMPVLFLLAPGDTPGLYWREGLLSLVIFLAIPARRLHKLSLQLEELGLGESEKAPEKTRQAVTGRIRHLAKLFSELSLGFAQATAARQSREDDERSSLLEDLMNRVCRSCLFRRRCWEKDPHSHHRLISTCWSAPKEKGGGDGPSARRLPGRCHQPEALVGAINNLQELMVVTGFGSRRLERGRSWFQASCRAWQK